MIENNVLRGFRPLHFRLSIFNIKNKNTCLFSIPQPSDGVIETSTGLFDSGSKIFLMTNASMLSLLCVAFVAGLSYHYVIFVSRKKKGICQFVSFPPCNNN